MSQIVRRCILINGTMGAGKTTVCKELMRLLPHSAFLDGDWCWYSDPFTVNDRTKEMVLQNIGFVLSNFLRCPDYQNILFCWVMDRQEILDEVIRRIRPALDDAQAQLFCVTLSVTPQALRQRLQRDIDAGLRQPDIVERSLARLPLYRELSTRKVDVSDLSTEQIGLFLRRQNGSSADLFFANERSRRQATCARTLTPDSQKPTTRLGAASCRRRAEPTSNPRFGLC